MHTDLDQTEIYSGGSFKSLYTTLNARPEKTDRKDPVVRLPNKKENSCDSLTTTKEERTQLWKTFLLPNPEEDGIPEGIWPGI